MGLSLQVEESLLYEAGLTAEVKPPLAASLLLTKCLGHFSFQASTLPLNSREPLGKLLNFLHLENGDSGPSSCKVRH